MDGTRDGASVLVPGIDAPSTVACLRSLHPRGVGTIVGSERSTTPATASRHCDEFVELPDPAVNIDAYSDALLAIAKRPDVRTVIPVREEDIYVLAANRDAFADVVATPWPTLDTLRQVQDRVELIAAAERAGVATPDTTLLDEWTEWDRETIVKPRYTVAAAEYLGPDAESFEIGSTRYQTPGEPPDIDAYVDRHGHVPLVQERISDSREYGFFALYDHGEPVATFQHCQHRGWEYCGGPSAYRESISEPALERAGRELLDELDWHGLAMVEFLRDPRTGGFTLMEINPRFWSSLPFSVRVGADFPYYYWSLATDTPIDPGETYDVDVGGHLLRGEASYLHSILAAEYPMVDRPHFGRALQTVATSLVRQPRFDYAVAGDPLPFLRDGLNVARDWWARDDHPQPPAESRSQGSTTPVADDEDAVGVGSSVGTDR